MPLMDNFLANLVAACESKAISQRELSRKSGIHFVTVNRIFSRKLEPSITVCERLAKAAGIPTKKIFAEI